MRIPFQSARRLMTLSVMGAAVIFVLHAFAATAPPAATATNTAIPPGPAGDLLRGFEAAVGSEAQDDAAQKLRELQDQAARESITPAILSLLATEDETKAFALAYILTEWDPVIGAQTNAFQRFVPSLGDALKRGETRIKGGPQLSDAGAAMMLARMNRAAAQPIRQQMFDSFNRAVSKPIEGESEDCWRVAVLALLIEHMGPDGVPALVKGLDHGDRWVRICALGGLTGTGELGDDNDTIPGWKMTPAEVSAVRTAARKSMPKMIDMLDDKGPGVPEAALKALAVLVVPADATPEFKARMLAMKAGNVLAAMHPAATAELLAAGTSEGSENEWARGALSTIGGPVIRDLMRLLFNGEVTSQIVANILEHMDFKYLPDMAAAAKTQPPAMKPILEKAYGQVYGNSKYMVKMILDDMTHEQTESAATRRERRLLAISRLLRYALVAQEALPALTKLADEEKDEQVKSALRAAVDEIHKLALPPDISTGPKE